MARVIDASILIEWERGKLDLRAEIITRQATDLRLSVVTASEMLHGVARAKDPLVRSRRAAFVEQLLAAFPFLPIDLNIARIHSQLWADLQSRGTNIGAHDLWLAATCVCHDLTLVTANEREFRRVPGLAIENWLPPG